MPAHEDMIKMGFLEEDMATAQLWGAIGCTSCANGYKGRFAILEALPVDEDVKKLIIERRSAMEMKNYARKNKGMLTLRRCGLLNAMRGRTTLEEILRMTMGDD
jgi:type II secretory ATPase GspE/PulE/Tfp pilus assembly ATPase PilB-like protein